MKIDAIHHYLKGRLFEWAMSCAMVLLAIETIIWPRTLEASAFH